MAVLRLPRRLRFRGLVGTGGIGWGSFFRVSGNQTLGREESRSGRFLDQRDFCKLHIISHYVKLLLGDAISVFPIGRVGGDEAGALLLREMAEAGMDMRFARSLAGAPTLFSFCLLYPDGSGGNLTTEDSASSRITPADVSEAEEVMRGLGSQGIALAAPEAPLSVRAALLEAATRHGLFRAASFTRAEIKEAEEGGLLALVDLCAINLEEAAAAARMEEGSGRGHSASDLVQRAAARMRSGQPDLLLSITAGSSGSWCLDMDGLAFDPAVSVPVQGTSGAGDAHFSGVLAGLAAGLALSDAQQLGTIVAAASVTSPHTIHPVMTGDLLRSVARLRQSTSPGVLALLDIGNDRS